jgi:hypothetical protein
VVTLVKLIQVVVGVDQEMDLEMLLEPVVQV